MVAGDRPSDVHVMDHPLIQHKLSILRDVDTGSKQFRELSRSSPCSWRSRRPGTSRSPRRPCETPVAETTTYVLSGKKVAVIPILRAGLGMVEGILELIPSARVGHVGLYRDPETLEPVEYYCKLPARHRRARRHDRRSHAGHRRFGRRGRAVPARTRAQARSSCSSSSPPPRASPRSRSAATTCRSTPPQSTAISTNTATSSRDWAMPATVCSAPSSTQHCSEARTRMPRPSWDDYFMDIAEQVSGRSTCLRRHIGAVLVKDKRILATGYNGVPSGLAHCDEVGCLREQRNIASGSHHELCRGHPRRAERCHPGREARDRHRRVDGVLHAPAMRAVRQDPHQRRGQRRSCFAIPILTRSQRRCSPRPA